MALGRIHVSDTALQAPGMAAKEIQNIHPKIMHYKTTKKLRPSHLPCINSPKR